MRAPNTTREKMSRPVESVPNQNSFDGGRYLIVRFVAPTSCGAIHGANSATRTSNATMIKPMIVRRFIETGSRNSDSRIQPTINHISEGVRKNVGDADYKHATLHDSIVTFPYTVFNQQ